VQCVNNLNSDLIAANWNVHDYLPNSLQ
jgi:hypothetical protein